MPTMELTYEKLTEKLEGHFGSEHFYPVNPFFRGIVVTEGVKDFLETCSCFWLMDEILFGLHKKHLLHSEFLLITIKAGKTGRIIVEASEDSGEEPIFKKSYRDLCKVIPSAPKGKGYKFYFG